MISPLDSRVMDANSEALGVSVETLMGNAGKAIADYLSKNFSGKKIAFFCGHGNNGGDGFAADYYLKDPASEIILVSPLEKIVSPTVRKYLSLSGKKPIMLKDCTWDFDVLVDCGLGTGLTGELRPAYLEYVKRANEFKGTIISVDVPTGLGTGNQVRCDKCLTMHDIKYGMNETNCGEIIILDISMPEKAYSQTGPGDMLRYPVPNPESHKGSNGRLLIIGGGPYFGAPSMAAMAALRTGADLVTVAAPESVFHEIACCSPVLMIEKLPGDHLSPKHVPRLLEMTQGNDAVLIGPGLGRNPETTDAVRQFLSECEKPVTVDADAINAVGEGYRFKSCSVVTPHAREFLRLGGKERTKEGVRALSDSINAVVLLKGKDDMISDGKRIRTNSTGCAGMTGAGTGDVLSGIVSSLLSKGLSTFDSACLGAYISGKAGELAFSHFSYGMIATDVIDCIPSILREGLESRKVR